MSGERAALDAALAAAGENIVLRRRIKVSDDTVNDVDVTCRARIDTVGSNEIAGTIAVSDLKIIISPTPILDELWPDGMTAGVPRTTDFIVARGKLRQIKVVDPKYIGDEGLCRINLVASG
jgi:hypothetical protein